ncbi:MAG: flagellar hook-length control protein FliK [Roseibium sp.]
MLPIGLMMDVSAGALAAGSGALKAAAGLVEGDTAPTKEFVGELDDYLRKALGFDGGDQSSDGDLGAELDTEELLAASQTDDLVAQNPEPLPGAQNSVPLPGVQNIGVSAQNASDEALLALGDVLTSRPPSSEGGESTPERSVPHSLGLVPTSEEGGLVGPAGGQLSSGLPGVVDAELAASQQVVQALDNVSGIGVDDASTDVLSSRVGETDKIASATDRKWQSELLPAFRATGASAIAVSGTPLAQVNPQAGDVVSAAQALSDGQSQATTVANVQATGASGSATAGHAPAGTVLASQLANEGAIALANADAIKNKTSKPATEQVASVSSGAGTDLDVSFFDKAIGKGAEIAKQPLAANTGTGTATTPANAGLAAAGPNLAVTSPIAQPAAAGLSSENIAKDADIKAGVSEFTFSSELGGTVRGGDMQGASRTESLQTPNQSQSSQVATQVAVEIAKNLKNAQTRFQMRFDPPELGRVEVNMKVAADGSVQAHLIVERPETLDMFMRDQRGLERALEAAGLNADSKDLQFSLKQDGGQQFASGDDQSQQGLGSDRDAGVDELEAGDFPPEDVMRMTLAEQRGGLDLKI